MIDFSNLLAGLDRASEQLNRISSRVARAGDFQSTDVVDLSAEAVALLEAQTSYKANIKMTKAADEITKSLLDLFG